MSGRFGTTTPETQVCLSAASVIRMSRYGCLELRTLAHSSSDLAQFAYLNRTELELFDLDNYLFTQRDLFGIVSAAISVVMYGNQYGVKSGR